MSFAGSTPPVVTTSDAVSQLVQLAAKNAKLTTQLWSGKGHEDIQRVVNYAKNQEMIRTELWQALGDILRHDAIKKLLTENEDLQATVAAHILRARGNIELKTVYNIPSPPNAATPTT